jgi:hypothetical protein
MSRSPLLTSTDDAVTITADSYTLSWTTGPRGVVRSPYLRFSDAAGRRWSRLCVLSSVHTLQGHDEATAIEEPRVDADGDDLVVRVATASSRWESRVFEVRCTATGIELTLEAAGSGDLADVTIAGGDGILPTGASGTFRSSIDAASLYVPTPPLALAFGRSPATDAVDAPAGDWLAATVRAPVDELRFTALRYEPLDGGYLLRFTYEGHTRVDGTWRSPTIVLQPVGSAHDALTAHRDDLLAHGHAEDVAPRIEPWWREPLFCGWGAQVARGGAPAPEVCRQEVYDEFLAVLRGAQLDPGTIVVDDRWQRDYGTAEPDADAWPDLRGWIAERHAEGRRVLLWWKAWDPAGLPAEECITDAAGRPIAADPGSPAYRARLRAIVARLLGPDGLDADGFKVDFTQRAPSGRTMRHAPGSDGVWGVAALHRLVSELHAATKAAKPDALVITHTVHPSFGAVSDMIRTNDVLERDVTSAPVPVARQLRERHAIVARTLPHHPVDTDQWPMPGREEWLDYSRVQATLGVPALYYLERVRDDEPITADDLAEIRATWDAYRRTLA